MKKFLNKINTESKKWFIVSYLGMLIIFFTGLSRVMNLFHPLVMAGSVLALVGLAFFVVGILMHILYIGLGFFLGKILKKHILYLAKGFTYGSITILILTGIFIIVLNFK